MTASFSSISPYAVDGTSLVSFLVGYVVAMLCIAIYGCQHVISFVSRTKIPGGYLLMEFVVEKIKHQEITMLQEKGRNSLDEKQSRCEKSSNLANDQEVH